MDFIVPILEVELIVAIAVLTLLCLVAIRRSPQILPGNSDQAESQSKQSRSCSLAVQQNKHSTNCCLLQSKSGKPLAGGALKGRTQKLQRLEIWLDQE